MPLGRKLREKQNKKDKQIYNLRKHMSDKQIAESLGMSTVGVWKARKRHENKLKKLVDIG